MLEENVYFKEEGVPLSQILEYMTLHGLVYLYPFHTTMMDYTRPMLLQKVFFFIIIDEQFGLYCVYFPYFAEKWTF